mmetsp:Transcript_28930/g.96323  ORF Transcript_28930/g.96323 Transcript_28930/m.96323 type:complete len:343 (+) Transcript_28930:1369-2397(+)
MLRTSLLLLRFFRLRLLRLVEDAKEVDGVLAAIFGHGRLLVLDKFVQTLPGRGRLVPGGLQLFVQLLTTFLHERKGLLLKVGCVQPIFQEDALQLVVPQKLRPKADANALVSRHEQSSFVQTACLGDVLVLCSLSPHLRHSRLHVPIQSSSPWIQQPLQGIRQRTPQEGAHSDWVPTLAVGQQVPRKHPGVALHVLPVGRPGRRHELLEAPEVLLVRSLLLLELNQGAQAQNVLLLVAVRRLLAALLLRFLLPQGPQLLEQKPLDRHELMPDLSCDSGGASLRQQLPYSLGEELRVHTGRARGCGARQKKRANRPCDGRTIQGEHAQRQVAGPQQPLQHHVP